MKFKEFADGTCNKTQEKLALVLNKVLIDL